MNKHFQRFFSFLAALTCCACLSFAPASAQTPTEMQYQLLVLNPETGQVRTSEDVAVRLELRQGSATGQAVWSQNFSVRTDARGLCQLTLDFGSGIDWSKSLFLAAIVDGEECGAPKLTAVPYARQAAQLDGIVTAAELVGTWQGQTADKWGEGVPVWVLKADGTGQFYDDEEVHSFSWTLSKSGMFFFEGTVKHRDEPEVYPFRSIYFIVKLADGKVAMARNDDDAIIFIKQSN